MERHAVLVFHGQELSDEQHLAFTRQLGELEPPFVGNVTKPQDRRLGANLSDISNLDKNQKILARDDRRRMFGLGNRLWHSDSSYRAVPAKYSLLYGRVVPPTGGNTEFADMRAAYATLDHETKAEIENLVCEHSLSYSRALIGFTDYAADELVDLRPVRHRLVRTLPTTGTRSLFLSSHIGGIVGWPRPEAMAFIRDLIEHATQRQFVHVHEWRKGDLIIWDNRQTMHRVRRFDDLKEPRELRRTTTLAEAPTVP